MVQTLNDRAEGWVAGLLLMLKSVNYEKEPDVSFVDMAPELMFNYFSKEIFHGMDSQTQDFLAKTSILPFMTPEMAMRLTGNNSANSILAQLNRNNFFTTLKQVQSDPVYQYHALFREFLLSIATDQYTPNSLSKLQEYAAELLEEAGQVAESAELLCKFNKWELLAGLIYRHAETFVTQGSHQLLSKWLKNIPDNVIKKKPWLIYWKGVTSMLISPAECLRHFEKAFDAFKTSNDKTGRLLALSGAIDAITNESMNFSLFEPWFRELGHLKSELDAGKPGRIEYQVIGIIFFALTLNQPEHPDYEKWKQMALSLFKKSSDPNLRIFTAWPLGVHYYWAGDIPNSKLIANELQQLTRSKDITPLRFIMAKLIETLCNWLTGMFDESLASAAAGLKISRATGVHMWDLHLLTICVASSIGLENSIMVKKFIDEIEARRMDEDTNFNNASYNIMLSWNAILTHDYTRAKVHAEMALNLCQDLQATLPWSLSHYAISQVSHEAGDYKDADGHLEKAFNIAFRMRSSFVEFMCHIAKAQFAFDRNENKNAIMYLRDAMVLGKKNNLVNFYFWRPDVMAKLCVKALENGIEKEYVKYLIRTRSLVPDTPPLNLHDWPWQINVYTLGQFSILQDEQPIEFSGRSPRKPIEMIKTLIAYGNKGINSKQMMDLLWPEAEGDAAHNSFFVTLKRLRELIGVEGIINFQHGHMTINTCLCWIDVWEFEQIIIKIDNQNKAWNKKTSGETIKLMNRAISIYKGPFSGNDVENTKVAEFANRLNAMFISCIDNLGYYLEQKGSFKEAINCYQNGLETDSTSEKFYQRLMFCYQQIGHKTVAIDYYNQCKKVIAKAFGTEVSKKTNELYVAIREDV